MVPSAWHRTLKTTAGILVLPAVAVPCSGLSQTALELDARERERQIIATIDEKESQAGTQSTELIGPLTALALFHQEDGNHGAAIATIERARQIVRINHGLYSIEETPLIRQLIHSEEARGNVEAAWELEQHLLAVAPLHGNDLRMVAVYHETADRRMDVLRRYFAGEFPPQIVLGCYYDPVPDGDRPFWATQRDGHCHSGSRGVVLRRLLAEAQVNYARAIDVLLHHELYASNELEELETKLIRGSYRFSRYGGRSAGRASLSRRLGYRVANSAPLLARVDALVQMADWDLLFVHGANRNSRARRKEAVLERYEQAYAQLKGAGIAQASIDALFSPEMPIVLPTVLPNPLDSTEASDGHIEVSFVVTRHGESDQIEILDATTNATDAAKHELVRLIERSQFRPRAKDGEFADASPVVLRYYFNEP